MCAAAFVVVLLFVNAHIAYSTEHTDSWQMVSKGNVSPAPVGTQLSVYLAGDQTLAPALKTQIAQAMQARDLPFDQITFLDALPKDSYENPFLAIRIDADGGLWTPLLATRHVKATILYLEGRPLDRDAVLTPDPRGQTVAMTPGTCKGECSYGRRTVDLNASARGLVSLPYIRAYAASKVAQEAAILVADGLPEHLNPAKWPERSGARARERLGDRLGGGYSTFQRMAGCRGGIVAAGTLGAGSDWSLMYYDAGADAITETLTRAEVQAKLPGVKLATSPDLGIPRGSAWSAGVGDGRILTLPAGACGLAGWQITGQ